MDIVGAALSGLQNAQVAFSRAATRIADPAQATGDLVSLSSGATDLIQARDQFSADIKVLKVADDIEKATISLLA